MSNVKAVKIQPNEPRDFYDIDESALAYTRDLWHRDGVVGLDWHVFNDGAGPLTVTLDGGITVTIPAGQHLGMDNVKFTIITVTAIQHRLIVTGVHKRRL